VGQFYVGHTGQFCIGANRGQLVEEMPVSIQRIQTDRGQEFFAYKVQDRLRS